MKRAKAKQLKNLEVTKMIEDPIVEEVRRYRREHAAKYGNDLNSSAPYWRFANVSMILNASY